MLIYLFVRSFSTIVSDFYLTSPGLLLFTLLLSRRFIAKTCRFIAWNMAGSFQRCSWKHSTTATCLLSRAYRRSYIFRGAWFQFILARDRSNNRSNNRAKVSYEIRSQILYLVNYVTGSMLFKPNFHVIRVFIESDTFQDFQILSS